MEWLERPAASRFSLSESEMEPGRREQYSADGSLCLWETSAPTVPSSTSLSADRRTVVLAALCCLVFFFMVMVLLLILYRKIPHCCKMRVLQSSHSDMEAPLPQHYNSRQTLFASCDVEQTHDAGHDNLNAQSGSLFFIGVPGSYYLSSLEPPLPRLPSYESVRKKDRQRQIHMMIADRFGLSGPVVTEPPPSYEDSVRQSIALDTLAPEGRPVAVPEPATDSPAYEALPHSTDSPDPNNTVH